jgi:hypothetical protein
MRAALLLSLSLLLSSCSCLVSVTVSGSLAEGITFALRESHQVQLAYVLTRRADWTTVWRIDGPDRVGDFRYGEVSGEFRITVQPETLVSGEIYDFRLETTGRDQFLAGPCIGSVRFVVTSSGSVAECSTDECPERLL